jgi:hypothetical protein
MAILLGAQLIAQAALRQFNVRIRNWLVFGHISNQSAPFRNTHGQEILDKIAAYKVPVIVGPIYVLSDVLSPNEVEVSTISEHGIRSTPIPWMSSNEVEAWTMPNQGILSAVPQFEP